MRVFDFRTRPDLESAVRLLSVRDAPACDGVADRYAGPVLGVHSSKAARVRQTREDQRFNGIFEPQQLTLIPAGHLTTCWTDAPSSFLHVHFGVQLLDAWLGDLPGAQRAQELPGWFRFDDPFAAELAGSMARAARAQGDNARLYVESAAVVLVERLLQRVRVQSEAGGRAGLERRLVRRIDEYLRANLERNPGLDELAGLIGVSSRQLSRLFARATGVPPHRYLNQLRLERARQLLAQRGVRVIDVALAVGFANPSHFATFFRRGTGFTPQAFQRRAGARGPGSS